ncbi:MAG: hypothetical protein ACJ8CR_24755, partial [Roseiflexaceae bacterium]
PFAQRIGVTPSYINDIVNKRRLMSDRILATIGIERTVTVEYCENPNVAADVASTLLDRSDTAS